MRPKRVGAWHRVVADPEHWEHQPSGTALSWLGDGWVVRFPSTKAVAFTVEDALAMAQVMVRCENGHGNAEKVLAIGRIRPGDSPGSDGYEAPGWQQSVLVKDRGLCDELRRAAEAANEEIRRLAGVPSNHE